MKQELKNKHIGCDGVCHCPVDAIEYLIGVDNLEYINVKTGRCKRCDGKRLNKLGITLKGKRKFKDKNGKL